MRIPVLLTCLLAAMLAAAPTRSVRAQDAPPPAGGEVNFDLFYNNLSDDGEWYNTPDYGYVWQPDIAYNNDKWRPYSDGYWAQTDSGWTWVAYENFGWATYHYGRWTRLKDIGWAWVPGYEWGPGWVSWRTNDDYVGWAPLPPKAERGVYEGRIADRRPEPREELNYNDVEAEDTGYTPNVDVDYDIGPENYCFVETRSFGAPVLSEVVLPPQRNFVICEDTRNVTNIYYDRRGRDDVFVYNSGPDYNFISAHSERPIQRLQIEQRRDPGFLSQGLRAGGNPTQVHGGILQVAAPLIARGPMNFQRFKPVHVKETIAQPQVVHGWASTGQDAQNVDRLRNRFKEQAQQAPAKAVQPREQLVQSLPQERRVITKSDLPAGPAKDMSPDAVAARRAQRQQQRASQQAGHPVAAPQQPGNPAAAGPGNANGPRPGAVTDAERTARRDAAIRDRAARDQARQNGGQPGAAQPGQPAPNNSPGAAAAGQKDTSPDAVAARRAQRQQERANGRNPDQAAPAGGAQANGQNAPSAQPKDNSDEARAARRAQRQQERATQGQGQPANGGQAEAGKPSEKAAQPADADREARRAQRQQEKAAQGQQAQPQAQPAQPQGQNGDAEREARRAQRQQEKAAQQPQAQPQAQQGQNGDAEREARRAQRQQERAAQQSQAQPQAQPQSQNGDAEREARRAQRQQERAAQPQPQPQAQPQAANPDREARRAERQQQAQPQAQPQAQAQPQGNPDRDARRAERQAEKGKDDKKPNQ